MKEIVPQEGALVALSSSVIEDESDAERAYKAQLLKMQGHTWRDIAKMVGYPNSKHCQMSVRLFQQREALERDADFREQILDLEIQRTDELIKTYWDAAIVEMDLKAADFVLKTIAQQHRMVEAADLNKEVRTSKTIIIQGTGEEYVKALKELVEGNNS